MSEAAREASGGIPLRWGLPGRVPAAAGNTPRAGLAVVLGSGGPRGIGWEIGLLAGLAAAAVYPLRQADVVVGTSAGAAVAAMLAHREPAELYAAAIGGALARTEIDPPLPQVEGLEELVARADAQPTEAKRAAVFHRYAVAVPDDHGARRRAIAARLRGGDSWLPTAHSARLRLVVQDARHRYVVSQADGESLTAVVAASCAVPGLWPSVTLGGRAYMDGGMASGTNADAAGAAVKLLVLRPSVAPERPLREEAEALARAYVVTPVAAALDREIGPDVFSPKVIERAARFGFAAATDTAAGIGSWLAEA